MSDLQPPTAQLPRCARRARNLAIVIGLLGFAFIMRGGDSGVMVMVMGVAVVLAFAVLFGGGILAQNRLWDAQKALLESLGLERKGSSRFVGEVEGVPVEIVFKLSSGRVQSDYRRRRREVVTVEATEVFVGRDRGEPPRHLRAASVREKHGRWHWSGEKNTLDDPGMERFIRQLAREAQPGA